MDLFGVSIQNLTLNGVLARVREHLAQAGNHYVVTLNVDHVVRLQKDTEFRQAYRNASLVVPDGMPILWASRLLGTPLKERITGSDLVPRVCRLAAEEGRSVYFLGGSEGVAQRAAENLRAALPALRVAGYQSPPFGFESDASANQRVIEGINRAKPSILFVALGAPKQEKWIARHIPQLEIQVVFCIGSALDYPAAVARRAPAWMQRNGLEWLWRLLHEPARLGRRYLVEDLAFLGILLKEWRGKCGE